MNQEEIKESIYSSHPLNFINGPIINELTKIQLQELCDEIIRQIVIYNYKIQRQLEQTNKNYKLIIELCEVKLDLLSTYKDYKTVLATLSAGKKDLSTNYDPVELMVSERDPHE